MYLYDTRQDKFSDRGITFSDQASDHQARPHGIGRHSLVDEWIYCTISRSGRVADRITGKPTRKS